jgi:hypothetical protein
LFGDTRAGQDAMHDSPFHRALVRFTSSWRHNGGEKESGSQRKQGGPQRFSAQGRAYARQKESGPQRFGAQGRSQAQVAPFETDNNEKAG